MSSSAQAETSSLAEQDELTTSQIQTVEESPSLQSVSDLKCTKSVKFQGIAVGSQYKMNVKVAATNPTETKSSSATIYIDFDASQDPGGMYRSKERTVICTVKLSGKKVCTKIKESPMNIAYHGVRVCSLELSLLDRRIGSILVEVQITEPFLEIDDCPINAFLKQKLKMYQDGLQHGDIKLVPDKDHQPMMQTKKKRKMGELDHIHEEAAIIRTFSFVLKSASTVFESILNAKREESTGKMLEIHDATAKDVDDMIYYIICFDLRRDANPRALIRMAHLYELEALFTACSKRIVSDLKVHNFAESVHIFTRFSIEEGFQDLVDFGKANLKVLREQNLFQELPFLFRYGLLNITGKKKESVHTVHGSISLIVEL